MHYPRLDRTYRKADERAFETILRVRSRLLPKRGNGQFTFANPGEQRNVYRSGNRSLHPPFADSGTAPS